MYDVEINNIYSVFVEPDFLETLNILRELRNSSAHLDNAASIHKESIEIRKIVYTVENTTFDIINIFSSQHNTVVETTINPDAW